MTPPIGGAGAEPDGLAAATTTTAATTATRPRPPARPRTMPKAVERAYSQIRSAIVDGTFPPGMHLEEEGLADSSGVSRTPVREALRRLAAEGFVEFVPHQGAFVPTWTEADHHEIFDLRAVLESFGARLAARRVSAADLDELRALAAEMETAARSGRPDRLDDVAALNNRFHGAVLAASGNRRLRQLAQATVAVPLVLRTFQRYSAERLQRSLRHHREIVDALAARDESWAEAIMRTHILSARWELLPAREAPEPDPIDSEG
ncbi:MAG TPA: GntR family transcriptional regulator [Mycobacteriales bacterium]|nr:GntR family transcriptional regulator [Mycobacteriales bacterium]